MKNDEGRHFADVVKDEVQTLQGIGPMSSRVLSALGISTIEELANYKFFHMARALATLAETEVKGDRPTGSVMNVDRAVDKEWESKSLKEIVEAPTEALEGISKDACDLLETLGCVTIGDLAKLKYCRWAEAMVKISEFENTLTAKERKIDSELKKLA